MARITFDPVEADGLREAAHAEYPDNPALAYTLLRLADEGIDLDECVPWETIRERYGLGRDDDEAAGVA